MQACRHTCAAPGSFGGKLCATYHFEYVLRDKERRVRMHFTFVI